LRSAQQCEAAARKLGAGDVEGFVVVDRQRQRVKIKAPAYVQAHMARTQAQRATPLELAAMLLCCGEANEIEAYVDGSRRIAELATHIGQLRKRVGARADQLTATWFAQCVEGEQNVDKDKDDDDDIVEKRLIERRERLSKVLWAQRVASRRVLLARVDHESNRDETTRPYRQFFIDALLCEFATDKPKLSSARDFLTYLDAED
jgi:hypothetical protein